MAAFTVSWALHVLMNTCVFSPILSLEFWLKSRSKDISFDHLLKNLIFNSFLSQDFNNDDVCFWGRWSFHVIITIICSFLFGLVVFISSSDDHCPGAALLMQCCLASLTDVVGYWGKCSAHVGCLLPVPGEHGNNGKPGHSQFCRAPYAEVTPVHCLWERQQNTAHFHIVRSIFEVCLKTLKILL